MKPVQLLQVLGMKRVVVLAVLAAFNAGVAGGSYLYFQPEVKKTERELRTVRGQASKHRAEADRLRTDYDTILDQEAYYKSILEGGLIDEQDRARAGRRITDIQSLAKVAGQYTISPGVVETQGDEENQVYSILKSPVKISIEALDDLDMYNFIYWVENTFPGFMTVESLNISRVSDVTEENLRAVGAGEDVILVEGNIDFLWQTMLPAEPVDTGSGVSSERRR